MIFKLFHTIQAAYGRKQSFPQPGCNNLEWTVPPSFKMWKGDN